MDVPAPDLEHGTQKNPERRKLLKTLLPIVVTDLSALDQAGEKESDCLPGEAKGAGQVVQTAEAPGERDGTVIRDGQSGGQVPDQADFCRGVAREN